LQTEPYLNDVPFETAAAARLSDPLVIGGQEEPSGPDEPPDEIERNFSPTNGDTP